MSTVLLEFNIQFSVLCPFAPKDRLSTALFCKSIMRVQNNGPFTFPWKTFNIYVPNIEVLHAGTYLVHGMWPGQISQCGHNESLGKSMCAQIVRIGLMLMEVCIPQIRFGQQPVILRVAGQEDWVVL